MMPTIHLIFNDEREKKYFLDNYHLTGLNFDFNDYRVVEVISRNGRVSLTEMSKEISRITAEYKAITASKKEEAADLQRLYREINEEQHLQ